MGKKKEKRTHEEAETDHKERLNGDVVKKRKNKNNDKKKNNSGSIPTVSVAVPGSIIDNAQSLELATRLAGQIARAVTIFRIDEVVVFGNKRSLAGDSAGCNENGAAFLIRILQYLETPQYLRKSLFPRHSNLRHVGMLPPLDAPHHLRKHEWAPYREGVTLEEKASNSEGTMVDVGLSKNIIVNEVLNPGVRVTVAMGTNRNLHTDVPRWVVSPSKPREDAGMYWGYRVRYATNLSSVLDDCPFQGGYDHLIGTSEHGLVINSSKLELPAFRHLLIAFGGLAGLEEAMEEDDAYKGKSVGDAFHLYLNTCPQQGSRTIRTEEAIFISLQYFQEPIARAVKRAA